MRPKSLIGSIAAVACLVAWMSVAFASPETKIARAIDDMIEAYADGDVGDCTQHLAAAWSHEQSPGADRAYLTQGLRGRFLQDMQSRAERRAEIDEGTLEILAGEEEATSTLTVRFFQRRDGQEEELEWHTRLTADWRLGDDGWEVVRTRHENLSGRRPR